MFDFNVLDMFEFNVDEETFVPMQVFEKHRSTDAVVPQGSRPCFLFAGEEFDSNEDYKSLQNFFLDYFHGMKVDKVNLFSLSPLICVAVHEKKVYFRHYAMVLTKTGSKLPHVRLEEVGPHIDLIYRRRNEVNTDLKKQAMKQPKYDPAAPKLHKNIEEGFMDDKVGILHMPKQQLGQMATRRFKGMQKRKEMDTPPENAAETTVQSVAEMDLEKPTPARKKSKTNV